MSVHASTSTRPVDPPSILASLRGLARAVRIAAARIAQYVASKLAIPPTTVLPLALVALVIVAVVLQARRA